MVEADIHLKPLHTSILDMYKSVWDIGMLFQVHLRSGKTAIISWLRLTVKCGVTIQSNQCQLCTIYSKVNIETIPTNGPYHEWINGMVIGSGAKLRTIWISRWGGPKTIASSNISALEGKLMVWGQILDPNVRWDIVRKVSSSAFYWCHKNMVVMLLNDMIKFIKGLK
jgi:hypothetical protein